MKCQRALEGGVDLASKPLRRETQRVVTTGGQRNRLTICREVFHRLSNRLDGLLFEQNACRPLGEAQRTNDIACTAATIGNERCPPSLRFGKGDAEILAPRENHGLCCRYGLHVLPPWQMAKELDIRSSQRPEPRRLLPVSNHKQSTRRHRIEGRNHEIGAYVMRHK